MIALSIYLLLVLAVACMEAVTDALAIAEDRKIDHASELRERVILCLAGGLFIAGLSRNMEWRTLLWLPAAWGLFTPAFRWILNRKRGKPWYYVSRSNRYDTLFLNVTGSTFRDNVAAAGQAAYITEAVVLLASLILYAWASA